jgi:hypothetical protein
MTEQLIPEQQLRQAIRDILAEMLGITPQPPTSANREWYDTDPAYQLLGLKDSEQLREAVRAGLFRLGHEVRDRRKPKSKLPRYQFHIEKCHKRLEERPERRWKR